MPVRSRLKLACESVLRNSEIAQRRGETPTGVAYVSMFMLVRPSVLSVASE